MAARTLMADRRSSGFTLIEVMVALSVFSLAALALIRLEGATVRGAGIVDTTTIAQMVARNVAIDAVTSAEPPANGRSAGREVNGGRAWRWTRNVGATGDSRILRVDVVVVDANGTVAGRLTMVRPPTPPLVTTT